jgi:hypothetical protein
MRTTIRRRFARGAAAIELALLLVPLVVLTFGMTEIGRALYTYNTLLKSTRDGARYLSMQSRGSGQAVAKCLAVHGNTACSGDPLAPGLTVAMVEVEEEAAVPTGFGSIDLVRVRIAGYPFSTLMPQLWPGPTGSFTFGPVSTTMRQASS